MENRESGITQKTDASSPVLEAVSTSLEMASSRSFEIQVGKMQCRSSCSEGKAEEEKGTARHAGDSFDAEMADASLKEVVIQQDDTSHRTDDNALHGQCSACGLQMQNVHRMRKDGALRLYCTSCVLYHHQDMYCCQCFQVYPDAIQLGDAALWLTCSKCQRFCHMDCAQNHGLSTNSLFFACQYCNRDPAAESQSANSILKRQRVDDSLQEGCSLSIQETLAAAQIVAILTAKEAKDAKVRARACAAVAAKAAKLAKSALDVAHRAGLEEIRWRHEASRQNYVAAAPMNQALRKVQMGPYIGNVRTQQVSAGLDDKSSPKMMIAPYHRVPGKCIADANCDPNGSKAAATNLSHHQRRVLPPNVSPDVSVARLTPHYTGKQPPQQPFPQKGSQPICVSSRSGQHGSISSLFHEQSFPKVPENPKFNASPEGRLEVSARLGTATADTSIHTANPKLTRNILHDTDTAVVEIMSDEEAVDDFVDVGDLLSVHPEKEDVASSSANLTHNPPVLSHKGGTEAAEIGMEASSDCKSRAPCVMQNHQLVATSEAITHAGQPPGTKSEISSQRGANLHSTQSKLSKNADNPVS